MCITDLGEDHRPELRFQSPPIMSLVRFLANLYFRAVSLESKKIREKKYLEVGLPFLFKIYPNKIHLKREKPHRT